MSITTQTIKRAIKRDPVKNYCSSRWGNRLFLWTALLYAHSVFPLSLRSESLFCVITSFAPLSISPLLSTMVPLSIVPLLIFTLLSSFVGFFSATHYAAVLNNYSAFYHTAIIWYSTYLATALTFSMTPTISTQFFSRIYATTLCVAPISLCVTGPCCVTAIHSYVPVASFSFMLVSIIAIYVRPFPSNSNQLCFNFNPPLQTPCMSFYDPAAFLPLLFSYNILFKKSTPSYEYTARSLRRGTKLMGSGGESRRFIWTTAYSGQIHWLRQVCWPSYRGCWQYDVIRWGKVNLELRRCTCWVDFEWFPRAFTVCRIFQNDHPPPPPSPHTVQKNRLWWGKCIISTRDLINKSVKLSSTKNGARVHRRGATCSNCNAKIIFCTNHPLPMQWAGFSYSAFTQRSGVKHMCRRLPSLHCPRIHDCLFFLYLLLHHQELSSTGSRAQNL